VGFRFYAERIGSVFLFQSDYHHPPQWRMMGLQSSTQSR
jgi:hypothetical protein